MNETIKKRLNALETQIGRDMAFCLVEMPDGTQKETDIETWYENRHEWRWLKMTRGGDVKAVCLVLARVSEYCYEHNGSERMLEEARKFEIEYFGEEVTAR